MFKLFNKSNFISLDLGTINTLAYIKGYGIIFNEPTMLAYNIKTKEVIACGKDAALLSEKTFDDIKVINPIPEGVISDVESIKLYISYIFDQLNTNKVWKNSTVLLACPSSVTSLEKKVLEEIAYSFGAKYVFIEEEVKMAAIGVGIDIESPQGNLVIDVGGGTTDIAVISAGNIVRSKSTRIAGRYLNKAIIKTIKQKYNLIIGQRTAEEIKISIGAILSNTDLLKTGNKINRKVEINNVKKQKEIEIFGRDLVSGLPKSMFIKNDIIIKIFDKEFSQILPYIVNLLESVSSEISGDIIKNGGVLAGGGALIPGLDKWFTNKLGFNFKVGINPLMGVINGTKIYEKEIKRKIWKINHGSSKTKFLVKKPLEYNK